MKIRHLAGSIILGLMTVNANAFTLFNIDFPEGLPDKVNYEIKASYGDCTSPLHSNVVNVAFSLDLPIKDGSNNISIADYVQMVNQDLRNKAFCDNPFLNNPKNYIRFSVASQPNICSIDLLQNKGDILVHLKKNGSCSIN